MPTHVAFLRAINLGATRKFPKDAIVAAAQSAGFTDVATHINTGNVRLTTTMRSRDKVVAAMERAFLDDRGFEVPVALLTPAEVRAVANELDEVGEGHEGRHYVSFLPQEPSAEVVTALHALEAPGERVVPRGRAVHLLLGPDYHRSRLTNTAVERVAGMATNRNRTVVEAIAAKWC